MDSDSPTYRLGWQVWATEPGSNFCIFKPILSNDKLYIIVTKQPTHQVDSPQSTMHLNWLKVQEDKTVVWAEISVELKTGKHFGN
jgi:hypothetical protein